jgi:hypothetical protein
MLLPEFNIKSGNSCIPLKRLITGSKLSVMKRSPKAALQHGDRLADLRAASKHVGYTNTERLRWIVDFIGQDPSSWHSATRTAQGDCLIAFASPIPQNLVGGVEVSPPLDRETIEALHGEIRTLLRDLVNVPAGKLVALPIDGKDAALMRLSPVSVRPAIFGITYGYRDVRGAVRGALVSLLLGGVEDLLACPKCGSPFVRVRKQKYCSPACAQRIRNERKAIRVRKGR